MELLEGTRTADRVIPHSLGTDIYLNIYCSDSICGMLGKSRFVLYLS